MSLGVQPVPTEPATLYRLEALLTEAIGIADMMGYDLTAIRIEEAMAAVHDRNVAIGSRAILPLN